MRGEAKSQPTTSMSQWQLVIFQIGTTHKEGHPSTNQETFIGVPHSGGGGERGGGLYSQLGGELGGPGSDRVNDMFPDMMHNYCFSLLYVS